MPCPYKNCQECPTNHQKNLRSVCCLAPVAKYTKGNVVAPDMDGYYCSHVYGCGKQCEITTVEELKK